MVTLSLNIPNFGDVNTLGHVHMKHVAVNITSRCAHAHCLWPLPTQGGMGVQPYVVEWPS